MNTFTLPGLSSPAIFLKILNKIQSRVCNVINTGLASQFHSFSHHINIPSLYLFYKKFHGSFSNVLSSFVPWPHEFKCSTRLATRSPHFAVEWLVITVSSILIISFLSHLTYGTLFQFLASLSTPIFKSLNLISISIFYFFPEICSFIVLSS